MDYYAYKTVLGQGETMMSTYCLLPVSKDAVYVEGIFYSNPKVLVLLSKEVHEKFQMVPKVDPLGRGQRDKTGKELHDRMRVTTNYEYYLRDPADIEWFAKTQVVNAEEFLNFVNTPQINESADEVLQKTNLVVAE